VIPFEGPPCYIGPISSCQASKWVVALQRADYPRVYTPEPLPQSPLASSGWALSPWGGLCGGVAAANAFSVAFRRAMVCATLRALLASLVWLRAPRGSHGALAGVHHARHAPLPRRVLSRPEGRQPPSRSLGLHAYKPRQACGGKRAAHCVTTTRSPRAAPSCDLIAPPSPTGLTRENAGDTDQLKKAWPRRSRSPWPWGSRRSRCSCQRRDRHIT
jgi:hypothetical protein